MDPSITIFQRDTAPLDIFEDVFRDTAPEDVKAAYADGDAVAYEDGSGWVVMPKEFK